MAELTKIEAGKVYIFRTIHGMKEHTFRVDEKQVLKNNKTGRVSEIRVLASLDGGKTKWYYGRRNYERGYEYVRIEHWKTDVSSETYCEDAE